MMLQRIPLDDGRADPPPSWADLRGRALAWEVPDRPTLVVAPHPDDEVLGAAGIIMEQRRRNTAVTVLAVTDGENAYPQRHGRALAATRVGEQNSSLHALGVDEGSIHRLGLPDGGVASFTDRLAAAIRELSSPDTLIVAPWRHDYHCDHEAVGRAVAVSASRHGCCVVSSLFWSWTHREPSRASGIEMRFLTMTPYDVKRRRMAMRCHASQTTPVVGEPVLDPRDLRPLDWAGEYYLVDRG